MEKILIAAVSSNNVLGLNGKTPWHSDEEISHFKKTTIGNPVIMGFNTWVAIGKTLPGRLNIVLSKKNLPKNSEENLIFFNSLEKAVSFCEEKNFVKVFFIGGGNLFEQAIKIADKIILSKMNFETDGDVFFPEVNPELWSEISVQKFTDFEVHCYIRK